MYFPHLFARRAELLALRDVCEELPIASTTVPILEAVKSDSADLLRCLEVLGESQIQVCVIVNPNTGDFADSSLIGAWRATLAVRFTEYPSLMPSFVCRSNTASAAVTQFLGDYPDREVALLYWSPNLINAFLQNLVNENRIKFHINLHNQMSSAQRALLPATKAVDVEDHFVRLARNADYVGQEFFSDDHLTFSVDSVGFGDYSVIGFRFVPGGGQAYAVVIHAVYQVASGSIWVEHFVSNDTDVAVGSVEQKYLQAAAKLVEVVEERPEEFGDDEALQRYAEDVNNQNFPGLAMNKRRQIHHHIALVHAILTNEA